MQNNCVVLITSLLFLILQHIDMYLAMIRERNAAKKGALSVYPIPAHVFPLLVNKQSGIEVVKECTDDVSVYIYYVDLPSQ